MTVLPEAMRSAQIRVAEVMKPAPLIKAGFWMGPSEVYLKLESVNIGGSFKIRGAANTIKQLSIAERQQGIVASSAGNHAQAVAFVAKSLNINATIFMPERTPLIKVDSTRKFGARVELAGATFDEAFQAATAFQKEQGGIFVHAFANKNVIYGQSTVGIEIMDQLPQVEVIICPIGGGGLISGLSYAVKTINPRVRVIGVQTSAFPALERSFHSGTLQAVKVGDTIADGIAVKSPSEITWNFIQKYVDEIITVEEDEIVGAIMLLMERGHVMAEGAGAASFAGMQKLVQQGKLNDVSTTCCVISGGNLDVNILKRVITYGQIFSYRMMRIKVFVNDRPGELAEILQVLGKAKANVMEVQHNRLLTATQFQNVQIDLDLETMGPEHQDQIQAMLRAHHVNFEVTSSVGNLV